jgi:hypothetical protein
MNPDNLITDWEEAVGLTITEVKEFTIECDDPAYMTVISFNNGKFAVQRDQSYFTTSCGLLDKSNIERYQSVIEPLLNQPHAEG